MTNLPLARSVDIVLQETGNELLVYDLRINKAFCLNETARMIFNLCDGSKTISEISDLISRKLKTSVSEDLILLSINDLKKNGLMEEDEKVSPPFTAQTRRELVKKVSLASMVMLPIVSSIVAPSAAMAASVALLANCASCSSPLQCASNNCASGAPGASSACAPAGNRAGLQPGTRLMGICPSNPGACNLCTGICCSGDTTYMGFSCSCSA